ncbi:3-phosphoshikimate 1-carboxyvinyltransferase [Clostridium tarantellae]|uniref:3-phosphoshikimate 1-carboxyvinyltransferase n=1 Tax=Clostridium tarantellae TaxID=39493 RepID=A0A6I1MNP9_9CLOT|nr:3-phosphoshikimate 1-carboxyvinyltransferase [Clostridium tarantellae]MPQ44590.1 3-phosphoshikimate 1-carboxyvinyltransferase [Clostridium tarantellae]
MNKIKITPKKLKGEVNIPPSKSMAHRAIICASLSRGTSIIDNVDFSEDMIATINAMKALGADIKIEENKLIINGENTFSLKNIVIDCNESGSTLRFLVPLSISRKNKINFIGKGNLGKRPLNTYYNILNEKGIKYSYKKNILDFNIDGELKGGEFKVEGNISSQFISGLLFALPLLKEDSKIIITTNLESKGYIDLTLSMIEKFGIKVENKNLEYKEFIIKGNQQYKPFNYRVEGDYSQAAFYLCADALGNDIVCKDLNLNSLQGDKECIDILKRMGGVVEEHKGIKIIAKNTEGTIIDASQCPDVIPVLTVVAALSTGETKIINGERLRIKECDRLNAICIELNKLGANIKELKDGLIINGVKSLNGANISSHNDHRIAMSIAIASTLCKGDITLENPECVKKSYPSFWEDFKSIGGKFIEI